MSTTAYREKKKIKLTSLWKNTTKNGIEMFSGFLGDTKIEIWPNGFKKEHKHPDFIIYIVEKEAKTTTAVFESAATEYVKNEPQKTQDFGPPPNFEDSENIPF